MEGVKRNMTLDGAGIICLTIGTGLLSNGDYLNGAGIIVLGAGLLALKYWLR